MKKAKIRALLAVLALALLLSACSGAPANEAEEASAAPQTQTSESAPEEVNAPVDGEMVLVAEQLDLPEGMAYASAQCFDGNKIWLSGMSQDGAVFGFVSLSGESSLIDLPEGCEFVYAMCAIDEGVAVLAGSFPSTYMSADGEDVLNDSPEGRLELLVFDGEKFISQTELEQDYSDKTFTLMLEADGDYYAMSRYSVVKFSQDGVEQARFTLDTGNGFDIFVSMCLHDGQLTAASAKLLGTGFDSVLYHLNPSTLEEESTTTIEQKDLTGLGVDASGQVLAMDVNGMFSFDSEGEPDENILTWDSLYISGAFTCVTELENGYLLYAPYQEAVYILQYKQASESSERVELTLATDDDLSLVTALVNAFNKSQDEYYINVSAYDFYGNSDKTPDLLRTEIIAGNAPDIFALTHGESLSEVKPENAYIDLNEYLERNDGLSRSDFVEPLINAMSENGALYWLPYSFTITTFTVPESLVSSTNITLAEAEQAAASVGLPLLPEYMTKGNILGWSSKLAVGKFIDRENATCSFDSEDFIQLLKLCGEWGSTATVEDGVPLSDECFLWLNPLSSILRLGAISQYCNGDYCFVGFPTSEGSESMFDLDLKLAISNQSEKKDAAWAFLKFVLSEDGREADPYLGLSASFSANYSILNDEINDAIENGFGSDFDDVEVSEADIQKFWELVNNTEILSNSNSVLIDIISEEAGAYFAGNKTAEECAKLIQSRVSLYVAEQYG